MNKALKIVFASVFFALLALPTLHYFGVKEEWTPLYGWERKVGIPELTFAGFTNRTYQAQLTEEYSKYFFLRKSRLIFKWGSRDWHQGINRNRVCLVFAQRKRHINSVLKAFPKSQDST